MRTGFVSDIHLANHAAHGNRTVHGLNDRGRLSVATLHAAVSTSLYHACSRLIVCGDLFHTPKPEPALTATVIDAVRGAGEVVVIPGNHDMADASPSDESTSLEPLVAARVIRVIRAPRWYDGVLCVPFQAHEPMADHLARVIPELADQGPEGTKLLATHVGVYDDSSSPWLKGKGAIAASTLLHLLRDNGFAGAFVGDYHKGKTWRDGGVFVCQVGTLIPASHSDEGVYPAVGALAVYDFEKPQLVETLEIPGPRFATLHPGDTVPDDGNTWYVRATVGTDGSKADGLDRAAGVTQVLQLPASEYGATPTKEITDANEALAEYASAHDLTGEPLELAKTFWSKAG